MNQELIYRTIEKLAKDVYGIKQLEPRASINSFNAPSEDNEEFLRRFQEEFQIDMSGFNYYDFFKEDQVYLFAVVSLIMKLFGRQKKRSQLTIEHLVNVAQNKKWSQPS